jgi:hypothetical protein
MNLILSDDGLYGCQAQDDGPVVWFNSAAECYVYGTHIGLGWDENEYMIAIDQCRKHRHDLAIFGVYGTFMYSKDMDTGEVA